MFLFDNLLNHLFSTNTARRPAGDWKLKSRNLRLESLEQRELLSVNSLVGDANYDTDSENTAFVTEIEQTFPAENTVLQFAPEAPQAAAASTSFGPITDTCAGGSTKSYTFTVPQTGIYTVDLLFSHLSGNLDLRIYNASGTQVSYSASNTNNERIAGTFSAGTYAIKVTNTSASSTSNNYTLAVRPATPLGTITAEKAEVSDIRVVGGSVDYYTFTVPQTGIYTVDLLFSHLSGNLDLRIYNASGTQVSYSASNTNNERIAGTFSAGTYAIKVTNTSASSTSNNYTLVITPPITTTPLGAPVVTATLDSGKPKLSWAAVPNADTYRVYRLNADGKGWTNISGNYFKGTTFTDTSVPAGVHTYAVRAFLVDGATGSDFVSSQYKTVAVAPDAPTVTKTLENGKPKLTWNAVTGAVSYRVYRLNADGLGWTNISGNYLKTTTFTDTGLSAAGVYTYAVRAILNDGVTGSGFVSAKYATIGVTPTAPTVTKSLENGKPKLSWGSVTGAVSYRVYRLNDAGNGWINVSGNNLKLTTFTDTGVSAGKTYTYSVQAFLNDGVTGSGFVGAKYITVTV